MVILASCKISKWTQGHMIVLVWYMFHTYLIHKTLVMDGSTLKHFKHPDYENALKGTFRRQLHAFIFLT